MKTLSNKFQTKRFTSGYACRIRDYIHNTMGLFWTLFGNAREWENDYWRTKSNLL